MKRVILRGEGVQGMSLTISVCDMFAANSTANQLEKVINSRKEVERYKATPYDQRKELFPNGEPKAIEVDTETLSQLHTLLCKMSYSTTATIFAEDDELPETEQAF